MIDNNPIGFNIKYRLIEDMNLQSYQTLVEIADLASFSRVAERLNMTLSAVSMQMKTLERELGVDVFDRSVRPPRLTPLGREIAEHAQHVIAAQNRLTALIREDGTLRGTYRIGFIPTASVRLLSGFLARAATDAPAARIAVETGLSKALQEKVLRGQLDAAVVTFSTPGLAGLNYTTIRIDKIVYALPQSFADESLETCFARLSFILSTPSSGIGKLVSNHLAERGCKPTATMILDTVEAIIECVTAGIGFTALARPDVERYKNDSVVLRELSGNPLSREIAFATAVGSVADRQAKAFAALFSERDTN